MGEGNLDLESKMVVANQTDKSSFVTNPETKVIGELTQEQLSLIKDLSSNFQIYLGGGYADEVLLNDGNITRPHGDVDMWARREDQEKLADHLKHVGYKVEFLGKDANKPAKIGADKGKVHIDIPLLDFDPDKNQPYLDPQGIMELDTRFYFEPNALKEPTKMLSNFPVRTMSPLFLMQLRQEFLNRNIGKPERRANEVRILNELKARYPQPEA